MAEGIRKNKAVGESHYIVWTLQIHCQRMVEMMKTLRYSNDEKQHDETKLNETSNAYNTLIFVKKRP